MTGGGYTVAIAEDPFILGDGGSGPNDLPPQDDDSTQVDDIPVTGTHRPPDPIADWYAWLAYVDAGNPRALDVAGSVTDGGGILSQDGSDADSEPRVSFRGGANVAITAIELNVAVAAFDKVVDATADNAVIQLAPGQTLTGAQFKQMWNAMTFMVRPISGLLPGYTGSNVNGHVTITPASTQGYLNWHQPGSNFLFLHELAHNTAPAVAYYKSLFTAHENAGGTTASFSGSNPRFLENERYTNAVALSISKSLKLDILPESKEIDY